VRSPVIWCWNPIPVLLVPAVLDGGLDWTGVICHELAHFRRRDHISGLIAELIVCILPWNPLLWWSKKRMVRFSEQACDDWVVAGGRHVEDYAQSLLNFRPQKQVAFVPAVVSSKKTLAGRFHRILEERCSSPYSGVRWSLTAAAVAGCIAAGIAFAQTRPTRP
jgi:beta-lactamase regulating signal transducer with metallopeptidase domain